MYVLDTLLNRMRRGCMTMPYPKGPAARCIEMPR